MLAQNEHCRLDLLRNNIFGWASKWQSNYRKIYKQKLMHAVEMRGEKWARAFIGANTAQIFIQMYFLCYLWNEWKPETNKRVIIKPPDCLHCTRLGILARICFIVRSLLRFACAIVYKWCGHWKTRKNIHTLKLLYNSNNQFGCQKNGKTNVNSHQNSDSEWKCV